MVTSRVLTGEHPVATPRESMPSTPSLLRWVYLGRLCVAFAIFFAAAFYFSAVSPGIIVTVAIAAILSLLVTGLSLFHTHVRGQASSPTFLYAQALFDLALVTTVVHVTGGVNSDFASLYILVIAVSAVTMPIPSSLLVTILAAMLYVGDVLLGHPEVPMSSAVWMQIGVFMAVALATGYLASRVRVVGAQRMVLEREVTRLRLEAVDILRQIGSGIMTVDGDGTLVFANAAAERLLGLGAPDHLGRPVLDDLRGVSRELWAAILTTQRERHRRVRVDGRITRNGTTFPIGVTTTLHDTGDESPPSVTAIFTDISDQIRLQDLNRRAERLEAVAELSASLAHEIKNPLASIRSSVEQLGTSERADDDDRFLAALVVRESDRLSRLLTEFLDFSRVRLTDSHPVDLSAIVDSAVAMVRGHPACPDEAQITVTGGCDRIPGDEDLLHRVVSNLVLNALQASQGAAAVKILIRDADPSEIPSGARLGASVLLRIEDDGPGIPEELQERLFDPFVTGREGGTGLGLSIVQRAVEAHGGLVFVDTEREVGTTFSIFLPKTKPTEAAA